MKQGIRWGEVGGEGRFPLSDEGEQKRKDYDDQPADRAEVRRSSITTTVREESQVTGRRVRTGDH